MPASSHCIRILLLALATGGLAAQRTPEEALRALTEGNQRFATDRSVPQPLGEGVRRTLARAQSPFAVVLCCSDSRVPPEHVFNCGLGDLFVVRVAGNTCDPETLASVEYAVEHLNTPLVVVLGHEGCDAVAAAVRQVRDLEDGRPDPAASRAVQQLVERIEPAVQKARTRELGGKDLRDACEEENVHLTLHECLRRSPLLRRYVEIGRLQVVPARYHLDSGEVQWLPTRPLPPEPRHEIDPDLDATPPAVPPHVALRMLQAGHRRFVGDALPAGDLSATRRAALVQGQPPLAIVLSCADSRVSPELLFDAGLGELCVVRIAGAVVNDAVLASIEHAALRDGAPLLIVMGHTRCEAIAAAADHPEDRQLSAHARTLLAQLEPSVERARAGGGSRDELTDRAVRAHVLRVAAELPTRSAVLRDLEQRGRFAILPTVYDIATGDLAWLKTGAVEQAPAPRPAGETASPPDPVLSRGAPAPVGPSGIDEALPYDHGAAALRNELPPEPRQDVRGGPVAGPTDAHGEQPEADEGSWPNPVPWVGIAGIASLLLAAMIALFSR